MGFVPQGVNVILDIGKLGGAIKAGDIEQLRHSTDITSLMNNSGFEFGRGVGGGLTCIQGKWHCKYSSERPLRGQYKKWCLSMPPKLSDLQGTSAWRSSRCSFLKV